MLADVKQYNFYIGRGIQLSGYLNDGNCKEGRAHIETKGSEAISRIRSAIPEFK